MCFDNFGLCFTNIDLCFQNIVLCFKNCLLCLQIWATVVIRVCMSFLTPPANCLPRLARYLQAAFIVSNFLGQEPITRSHHLPYKPYETTFARIFLFLETVGL